MWITYPHVLANPWSFVCSQGTPLQLCKTSVCLFLHCTVFLNLTSPLCCATWELNQLWEPFNRASPSCWTCSTINTVYFRPLLPWLQVMVTSHVRSCPLRPPGDVHDSVYSVSISFCRINLTHDMEPRQQVDSVRVQKESVHVSPLLQPTTADMRWWLKS